METITTPNPREAIGGNNPPEPIELLRAQLKETHADLIARSVALLGLAERLPEVMDDEWEAKISEAIKSCTKFSRASEVTRLDANEPYRALIAATDAFFKGMSDKVDALKGKLSKDYLTPYQTEKAARERRRREEEARIARERAEEEERRAREERERVAEARRREEAARLEAERVKAARIAAEEKRKADAKAELERIERERQDAERREEEARTKKAREKAAREAAALEAERQEAEARQRRETQAARERERETARAAKADVDAAAADRRESQRAAAVARDRVATATQERNVTDRAAKASTADLSRTRTDLGAVASLRTVWTFEVVDHAAVPRLYCRVDEATIANAIKAATIDGKCTLKIEGVHIYPLADSVVR